MSPREVWVRLAQEFWKRADAVRRPGPEPVVSSPHTPARFVYAPEDVPRIVDVLRTRMPEQAAHIVEQADRICAHRFDLLGYQGLDFGREIDWHLDPVHGIRAPEQPWFRIPFLDFRAVGDHKIIWELNRHQHLVTLAKAWLLTGREAYAEEAAAQWRHWRAHNPYPLGINWASSLEVAFRALAWLWLKHLMPGRLGPDLDAALAAHARYIEKYLSTYFAPNTHLLGEGVALFFVGTLCPQFRRAARWRERGWRIVLEESQRQVRADGMHFEQSVYYHVYALDFFLHARILAERNGTPIPPEFDATVERMADLLRLISQGGAAPRFGDDDGGRLFDPHRNRTEHLLDPLSTVAGSLCEETLWLLGPESPARFDRLPSEPVVLSSGRAAESGFYVMTAGKRALVIDAGPHGTGSGGHGHADALSVQLIVAGRHWLTDPGTCTYPWEKPERDRFRGTAAHNTLEVDTRSQAEPVGPFAWRQPLPQVTVEHWIPGGAIDFFSARHDGYAPVTHRRTVVSWKSGAILVRDVASGEGQHTLVQSWHVGPEFTVKQTGGRFEVRGPAEEQFTLTGDGNWEAALEEGEWSAAYGDCRTAPVVRYRARLALPAEFAVLIVPGNGAVSLRRVGSDYECEFAGMKCAVTFRDGGDVPFTCREALDQ